MSGADRKLFHLALDVRQFLLSARQEDYERTFVGATGEAMPWQTSQQLLLRELELGHRFLPVGTACDSFDHRTGCAGHPL